MKRLMKVMTIVILIVALSGVIIIFSGCDKKEEKPFFEIRLYDDNWVELERNEKAANEVGYSYKTLDLIFEYDGTPKGYNAIAYKDGEEFARYTYKDENPDPLGIFWVNILSSNITPPPIKKGQYQMIYKFDTSNMSKYDKFETPIGIIKATELPTTLRQKVYITIV